MSSIRAKLNRRWWVRRRAVRGRRLNWSRVDRIVIHYPGNPRSWKPPSNIANYIRQTHEYWLRSRGYSLGYNYAVVSSRGHRLDGTSIEIRGDMYECAANKGVNQRSIAILIIQKSGEYPTPAAIREVKSLIRQIQRRKGRVLPIFGHNTSGSTTSTDCPGSGIANAVRNGVFRP